MSKESRKEWWVATSLGSIIGSAMYVSNMSLFQVIVGLTIYAEGIIFGVWLMSDKS